MKISNKDSAVPSRMGNLALNGMILNKQSSVQPKYPNHSSVYHNIRNNHDKKEFSSNEVDYEQQNQDYDSGT